MLKIFFLHTSHLMAHHFLCYLLKALALSWGEHMLSFNINLGSSVALCLHDVFAHEFWLGTVCTLSSLSFLQ